MADIVLDTDMFIDHLRKHRRIPVKQGWYSAITRAELYSGQAVDEDDLDLLLVPFDEVDVTRPIANRAGRVRREHQLALPDAIIAATALSLGVPLLTRNRKHFERVRGLKLAKM